MNKEFVKLFKNSKTRIYKIGWIGQSGIPFFGRKLGENRYKAIWHGKSLMNDDRIKLHSVKLIGFVLSDNERMYLNDYDVNF